MRVAEGRRQAISTMFQVAKLMWLLPRCASPGDVSRLFYTPVAQDLLSPPPLQLSLIHICSRA